MFIMYHVVAVMQFSVVNVIIMYPYLHFPRFSKQAFLQDVANPHELRDGSPSFMDFMGSRNNRFTTPQAAQKNRIQPPSRILHYFNAPPGLNEDQIKQVFEENGAKAPQKIKVFPSKCE